MQRTWTNTTKTWSPRRSRAGFTLLEVIVALIVITTMLSVAAVWLGRYNDRVANELVAGQMRRLGDALKLYADNNVDEIAKGSTPQHVPWDKLKPYLPAGLGKDTVNPLGQTYDGRIRIVDLDKAGKRVEVMIYTEGNKEIARHSMPIARLLGAGGFYFDLNRVKGVVGNKPTYWNASGQVTDTEGLDKFWFGGKLSNSDIGLVMYVPSYTATSGGKEPEDDAFLHRKAVAGKPELNRMETDINMNFNKINNVGAVVLDGNIRDIHGVKSLGFKFAELDKEDSLSITSNPNGWLVVGDPRGKRTGLWANEIEADGNLTVHKDLAVDGGSRVKGDSWIEGNSTVKKDSMIRGDEYISGTVKANLVTTGSVFSDSDVTIDKGDLVLGDSVKEGDPCTAVGHINRTAEGDLALCKILDRGTKWRVVTSPFSQGRTGSFNLNFMTGVKNNTTMYKDALDWNRDQVTGFRNSLNVPVLVTAITTGDYTKNVSRCFIGIYPADSDGYTSLYKDPIAFVNNAQHAVWEGPVVRLYNSLDVCSATFIAQPGERYNAVSASSGSVTFTYTY